MEKLENITKHLQEEIKKEYVLTSKKNNIMTYDKIDCIIADLNEGHSVSAISHRLCLKTDEVEIVKETYIYFKNILSAKDKMLADAHFELQEIYKKIANKFFND